MAKFVEYFINKGNIQAKSVFIPSIELPSDLPISTPFTFPMVNDEYMLALDKNGWWNPLGGHIEVGEDWITALKREALEEAGVVIENIEIFGYLRVDKLLDHPENTYPNITIMPITRSKIIDIVKDWQPMETSQRQMFIRDTAVEHFNTRNDNNQMTEIFKYMLGDL